MLEQTRVEPPESAAMGPVIERRTVRLTSTAVTRMLGSPGETGPAAEVRARPGTSVESRTWTVAVPPETESWPASQRPLRRS